MLTIKRTAQFKKDFRRIIKQGLDIKPLIEVIDEKFCDHTLKGE